MAATVFAAVCEAPIATAGAPTGETGWRIAIQALIASGGARVGKCRVGDARVSSLVWYDLTADVASVDWVQGSKAVGRGWPQADVGVGHLLLRNDNRQYSAWNSAVGNVTVAATGIDTDYIYREWAPKTIIRVVMFKPATAATAVSTAANGFSTITRTDWNPLFTGRVESWGEDQAVASNLCPVTFVETLADLAGITEPAVASVGSGETLIARIVRLLTAAKWKFPIVEGNTPNTFDTAGYTLQATTMDGNRLTELNLSAQSINHTELFSGNDGSLRVGYGNNISSRNSVTEPLTFSEAIVHLTDDLTKVVTSDATRFPAKVTGKYAARLEISNDPTFVVNDVSGTRVGGTPQNNTSPASIGANGRRSLALSGLICTTDLLANYAGDIVRREFDADHSDVYFGTLGASRLDQTIQPGSVVIAEQHTAQRALQVGNCIMLDRYDSHPTIPLRMVGRLIHAAHIIVPQPGSIVWTSTLSIVSRYAYQPAA